MQTYKVLVPEDVSYAETAHCCQTTRPAGIPMVGGPHLNDDEGKNSGVLRERQRQGKGEGGWQEQTFSNPTLSLVILDFQFISITRFIQIYYYIHFDS